MHLWMNFFHIKGGVWGLWWGRQESWGKVDPLTKLKLLYASDDGGKSWQQVGLLGPLQWPQIFSCNSGAQTRPLASSLCPSPLKAVHPLPRTLCF